MTIIIVGQLFGVLAFHALKADAFWRCYMAMFYNDLCGVLIMKVFKVLQEGQKGSRSVVYGLDNVFNRDPLFW